MSRTASQVFFEPDQMLERGGHDGPLVLYMHGLLRHFALVMTFSLMHDVSWGEPIAALVTLAGGEAFRRWRARKRVLEEKRLRDDYSAGLRGLADIYSTMTEIYQIDGVERVLLLEVSNGGDRPIPGNKLYAKAVQMNAHSFEERARRMQNYAQVILDDHYIKMVLHSQTEGYYVAKPSDMPHCMLRDIYLAEAVTYSEVFHVYTDHHAHKTWIMSVASYSLENPDWAASSSNDQHIRSALTSRVSIIRNDFSRYRKAYE